MSVAWAGLAVTAGSAIMSSQSSKKAGKQQAAAAADAQALEAEAAAQTREDLQPWVTGGNAAQNKLATYLGTGMGSTGMVNGMESGLTREKLREQLVGQYTRNVQSGAATPAGSSAQPYQSTGISINTTPGAASGGQYWDDADSASLAAKQATGQMTTEVDEAGLNAAMDKYYADQAAQEAKMASDPNYGSLLKSYKDGADFKFDATDLENEAGYKFGLDQGMKGIDRAQASRGNFLSGAAMKESTRYAQDYAGTKANDAYTRQAGTWSMNKSAFDTNKNSIYNFLTGQSTLGQNAAAKVGASNQQAAQGGSNAILAAGNASSAATIAGGNAIASGLNGAVNTYNTNNPNSAAGWNGLLNYGGGGYSGYTGYKGTVDPIANLNTTNGWTN